MIQGVLKLVDLTICIMVNFSNNLSSTDFFQNLPFPEVLPVISSEYQAVSIQIRPDKLFAKVISR